MRLFVALDIDDAIRERIARFLDGVRDFAPDARWVRSESLHVTLKFIGEQPPTALDELKRSLAAISAPSMQIGFHGYGFFPTPRAARVFWVGIEASHELAALAGKVDEATSRLGVAQEEHSYKPHLTLARGGGRSGAPAWRKGDKQNQNFSILQEKLSAIPAPEFGTMAAREFLLFQSKLSRGGAQYTKLERFALE